MTVAAEEATLPLVIVPRVRPQSNHSLKKSFAAGAAAGELKSDMGLILPVNSFLSATCVGLNTGIRGTGSSRRECV